MAFSWIFFTLMAAFMQAWRNAFQKQRSTTVDVWGLTLARFMLGLPFAALYFSSLDYFKPVESVVHLTLRIRVYVVVAGCSQILATALMVQLFKQRNYAVGVGLAKSEAILAAIIGVTLLADHLSFLAWLGVALGGYAVFLLSKGQQVTGFSARTL